jgi:hypothetical protein
MARLRALLSDPFPRRPEFPTSSAGRLSPGAAAPAALAGHPEAPPVKFQEASRSAGATDEDSS